MPAVADSASIDRAHEIRARRHVAQRETCRPSRHCARYTSAVGSVTASTSARGAAAPAPSRTRCPVMRSRRRSSARWRTRSWRPSASALLRRSVSPGSMRDRVRRVGPEATRAAGRRSACDAIAHARRAVARATRGTVRRRPARRCRRSLIDLVELKNDRFRRATFTAFVSGVMRRSCGGERSSGPPGGGPADAQPTRRQRGGDQTRRTGASHLRGQLIAPRATTRPSFCALGVHDVRGFARDEEALVRQARLERASSCFSSAASSVLQPRAFLRDVDQCPRGARRPPCHRRA